MKFFKNAKGRYGVQIATPRRRGFVALARSKSIT